MITGPSTEAKRDPTYQKQYDSIKTTNTTSSTSKASGNGSVYQIGSENGYNLAQSLKSNPGSAQTASDGSVWKSDSSGNIWVTKDGVTTKASITYKGSESSGAAGGSGVKASLEDRGNTLLSLMQQAMSGEKNYGLSFQSSANQKISDAYEQRKQSLIEQATKNGYYTSSDAKPGNTATQQAIRNAANQKIETALASGRTAEHARQAEQTRLKTQAQKVAQANEKAQEQGKARTVAEIDKKLEELDREYLGYATNPGSESADELKKQRKELKKQRKELTGEQNVFERIGKAVFGGAAQSLGSSMDAMGTLYQAGQGARNTISAGNLEWYQHQLETEQAALRSMLAENTERPGTYSQKAIQAQAKLVSVAQARVDAFQPGKEERAQEQGGEAARQMAEAVTNYGAILNAQAKKGEGKLGQITLDALSSTTQSAIDAAANMLLGTPGSMLPFAFRAFGGGTQEARNGGGTLGQQIAYGTATAAKEVFTEKLFSIAGLQSEAYGKGSLDDYVEKAISGAVDKLAKTEAGKNIIGGGLTLFANGGGEGLEELIGGWIDWQLPRIYGGETASAKQTLEDSFYDFLVGAVSGVLGSTTDAKVQNYTTARETARLVDPTASATDQAILDAINGVQTPENVTQTRQATATDNAISEAIMQGQSGITPDVATNKPKDVKNLLNATKEQITRYIQNAFNKQNQYKYLKISDVSPELAATLKTAGIDVDGYAHALRDNDLRHVDKSHGSQSNDKYKVTSEVLEQAQNIIDNYDALYRGYDTKAGNPTVVYEKRMGNRTFYVEEVLEDGLLGTKQMLITGEDSKPSFLKKMTKIASTSTDTSVPTQSGTTGQSPPGKHVQDAESSADYNQNVASTAGTVNTQNQESRNSVQGDNAAGNVSDVLNNAREQYGTIPAGEKAVREVSLPQSVNGRRKVSRFARTAAEAQSRTAPTTPTDVSQNATSTGTQLNIDNTRNNAYNYSTGGVTNGYTDQLDRTSGTGVWGRPDGYQTGAGTQRGTSYDGRGNLPVSGIVLLSPKSQQTLTQRGIVNVELHDSSTDSAAFSHALDAARAADQRNGWAVTPKSADELTQAGTKSYMDSKGSTGFAIAQDGDIEAVFANKAAGAPKGSTKSTIPQAIALGGNKLDCYGAGLVSLYSKYGFVPVARVGFNAEYANDGWTADKGSPDIYFMMHNGDSADTVVQNMGNYKIWSEADLAALPVMEYDEAYAYRDSLLKQRTSDALQNAREQYGTIPAGENPVREVSLPKSVNGRRKVSRFARTAAEAQVTTDEMVGRIEQMVADGKLDHSVYSNKQALSDGAKQIEHEYARGKSIEQIRSEFIRDANNGKAGAKLVSQGTTLYADAIAEGNYQAASDILVALTAVETNAGRTVQAARLMKSMTPEGRIFTVQKMVSNLEGQINQRRSANNQLELNVPDALLEAYQNATTQDAQQAALDSIYDYIAAEIPATLREGLQQWRYFSMLASPSTHLKNIMGNVSGAVAKIGKDSLAALGETLIIGDKEGRTKAFLNPMSKADRNLLNLSWADYSNAADLFEDSTGKYSQAAGEINDRRRYWKINDPQNALTRGMDKALGGLEKVSDFNSKALEVEDMWFSKPMYSVALAGYMKANHLTEITDAARTYAMTEAKRGTYNDINKVSKWATEIGSNSKLGRFLAGTIYPFKKVPANVMVRTLEYSPLGYLKGIYDIANMKGNPDITVAQALDDFAAATTGTALLGIGALLAKHGILRATGVGDEEEKEQQKNAFGAKDMSILVGDDYIPIDSLTLTGTGLLTGAQIWEAAQNSKNGDTPISLDDFLDALSKITDPVFEQSMLSGLDSILSTLQNSAGAGDGETATKIGIQILGNYIGQYVPSFVGRVASSLDKNQRSTYTEPNGAWAPIQSAVQGVQQKIPGLRENMAVRYGNWGVPVEGNGANGVGKAIFNAVTPVYPSTQKTDPVEEEIARLHDVNAEYSNFYKKPKKSIAVGGETVKLTSEQYARYVETHGQTDYSIRAAMLESDLYQNVSDKVKSEAMTLSEQYANALGKEAAGVGYESDDEWINELNGKTEKEIANALVAKAVKLNGYLSEESQKKLDTVKNLYDSGAYMGVSSDLIDSAKEKAEEYFKEAEQAKYGGELSEEKQALEGKNQKTLAEYFLEQAANAKFEDTNDDGTRMDEILDAYQDGDISEKLAMSMLGNQVVDAYADFGKDAGVTAEMVLQTANAYARMKTKKDIDDVVTLSVEAQLDDWLDKQNWTDKQKEALRLGYYTNRADSYNKLVEELENGSITVGEAKKSLTSKYQSAWTHKVSQTGTEMQDYISALAAYENAPSEAERDAMGFDSKWAWYCNELNKTDLTAEQKFAIVNATDNYAEKTQKKIAQALKATYVPTDSGGAGNSGGSYGSGGSSGSSSWISADDEQTQAEKAYERFGKDAGVTESMMQQAKDAKKEMYEIVDMDGNTVRSTEDQFDAWLAKQDWTAEQKEAVKAGFYTDAVKNLTWLSTNLRAGNISVAEAKFELSPTAQTGWSKNVLESGASMADYIDGLITFKQAPKEDERTALGYSTKWAWFCDYLNTTDLTAEQKYAVAISMSSTYADSTKKKIAKAVGWTGKKEDAATSKTSKTTTTSGTSDAFWDELARRLGSALISNESAQTTQTNTNEASQTGDFWKELERRLGSVLISSESTQATQPEETYQIRTNEGYRQYLNILAGKEDEYTASDGTVWTRGEDGEIYATKNGKRMRAEAVFDRADSTDGIDNEPEDGYTVNTPAGKLAYEMLKNGVLTQWDASDGWTWKRTEDGVIAVKKNMRLPVRLAG